jgi:Zn-dependent peptidase ImmA (M78 family)
MSRIGVQGFQSGRLDQILAVRRLSQLQLSALAGVSPATISKWRTGTQAPEREALDRLAGAVKVSPDWFMRPVAAKTTTPLFRSNAAAHVAAREMLSARIDWAQDIAISLSEFVDFPELNLPVREYDAPEEITAEDIEQAASDCREYWRLGRGVIQDLALAAESAGVILIREETGVAQIEGLSDWSNELGRPFVLLSSDKENGYRSRFDLAHELGHIMLNHHRTDCHTEQERFRMVEKQAHRFAGALLLPAESFAREVRVPPTLDDLLVLKQRWGVSVAAIIMRLRAIGLLDEAGEQALHKRRCFKWGAKSEPGDKDRLPEQPRLLRRTIELLVEERVMPLEAIPTHFGLSDSDIEMLAGLPKGYFKGRSDNVVQFARLRSMTTTPRKHDNGGSILVPFQKRSRI